MLTDEIVIEAAEDFAKRATFLGCPVGPESDAARVVLENIRKRDEQWLARLRAVETRASQERRAACAKVAEDFHPQPVETTCLGCRSEIVVLDINTPRDIAAAIRARG